ncbi:Hypothetical protein R9X50_00733300 [Acrodontium crateriforme]|uniref:NECAP PHear domain-containing protein n=1 Tax=Acrodontium crateriforme TaxID=150365 RepID=A0AAQ3MDU8_9PEZI|nr:Hypothetical protein R9X50_00733300 [Acrodontium crateriforme]
MDPAIQRVLFVTNDVHVYGIPPLSSNKGFNASSWTSPSHPTAQQIFTARLRIIETSRNGNLTVDIQLEDPKNGDLFAGAPYTTAAVVQQALDSSRFFAIRVQGGGGMKATLGIGFEERSQALDFSIALGDSRKVLGLDGASTGGLSRGKAIGLEDVKKDYSLKEGEKIHIQVGSKNRRAAKTESTGKADDGAALFSIAPPPPAAAKAPQSVQPISSGFEGKSAQELGFDDGEFGEFQ